MPFGIKDQRDAGMASGLFKEIDFLSKAQTGFWKPKTMLDQHVILSTKDGQPHQYADTTASGYKVEEPLVATKDIEVQNIKNLLPDEDDLFSGIIDKLRSSTHSDGSDGEEEFDLFHSGGGMELEVDNFLNSCQENSNDKDGNFTVRSSNDSIARSHLYGKYPSRTLFVGNVNGSLEDSELRTLFEQYGDIRTLYTACKHQGFVIISYFDIRAAWKAMISLWNKPSRHMNLDIHFSIPEDNSSEQDIKPGTIVVFHLDSFVSKDELCQIFGSYGEIKEINKTLQYHTFIEFYDIRSAEAAYHALNMSNIAGKQIKLELSHPVDENQRLIQQFSSILAQDERSRCESLNDNSTEQIASYMATFSPAPLTTSFIYGGSVRGLYSRSEMGIHDFNGNALSQGSFSVPNSLPVRAAANICNSEPRHSLDQGMSSNMCTSPSYHLHSLPNYYHGSANVVPYNPFSIVTDNKDPQVERPGGVLGSSWTSGCPLNGDCYVQSNSNSYQLLPTSPIVWPNSLPFVNDIHAHYTPKLPGLSISPPYVLNTVSHSHDVLNTVSPPLNLSRRKCELDASYMGESSEEVGFNQESPIGRTGFLRRSSDLASRNFLHDGNHIDAFINSAPRTQRRCHISPRLRKFVTSSPASVWIPKERMKSLSNCRSEADCCYADKIKYELDIDRVLSKEDSRTTLMIKNIPNKYSSKMLLATIDEQHRGTYDFLYLPIDFKNNSNMGYAFINMIDPLQIVPFYKTFNGKRWEKFNSGKVAYLAYARIQGKAALVAHFQNSSLMNVDKQCRPILFCSDGPNAGNQEPFPSSTGGRSRSSKVRSSSNEENHNRASPASFVRGEVVSSGTNFLSGSVKDTDSERTTNSMH